MSGIEIVACVAGIIQAFHAGVEVVKRIRQRKQSRGSAEVELVTSLENGAQRCEALSSRVLQNADSTTRNELELIMNVVVAQQELVQRLIQNLAEPAENDPDIAQINSAVASSTRRAATSVASLRQRIETRLESDEPDEVADVTLRRTLFETMANSVFAALREHADLTDAWLIGNSPFDFSERRDSSNTVEEERRDSGVGLDPSDPAQCETARTNSTNSISGNGTRRPVVAPYCAGAMLAQGEFENGFETQYLPVTRGSSSERRCWRCKECDFHTSGFDASDLTHITFHNGIRYRWSFLAKSHVKYEQPKNIQKPPNYTYGCLFCTLGGRSGRNFDSVEKLMKHITDKHRDPMSADVRRGSGCMTGTVAGRDEVWDINIPDMRRRRSGLLLWLLHAATSIPMFGNGSRTVL